MLREYVSTLIGSKEHTVKYRFQCEHCGKDSGWLQKKFVSDTVELHAEAVAAIAADKNTGRFTNEGLLEAQRQFTKLQDDAVNNVLTAAFYNVKKGQYGELGMKSKCPHCGKLQTWTATRTFLDLFIGILVSAVILSVILLGLIWLFARYSEIYKWAFYIAFPFSALCYTPSLISLAIKKARTRNAPSRQKPVIDWNGWNPPPE